VRETGFRVGYATEKERRGLPLVGGGKISTLKRDCSFLVGRVCFDKSGFELTIFLK
jgi:hypothetical protein